MTTKYTNAIDGNQAIMLLYGVIGDQVNAAEFADEMYWHKSNGRDITVKINSPGGDVFDGYAMIDATINCEANTHIVGMAASMAGVLAQFGKKRMCNDFAVCMIHAPQGKNKDLVDLVRMQLSTILSSRSKMKKEDLEKIMSGKEEYWYDASQMAEMGLIDEILSTQIGNKNIFGKIFPKMENMYQIYAQLIQDKPNKEMDLTQIASKLSCEAKEDAITAKLESILKDAGEVTNLKAKIKELEGSETNLKEENQKLIKKVSGLEAHSKDSLTKAAKVLISNAIKTGKISASDESIWIESAIENFERTSKMIEAMRGGFKSVAASIDNSGSDEATETYESLAKNNPEKLREIAEKNPERFEKLVKAHNKK